MARYMHFGMFLLYEYCIVLYCIIVLFEKVYNLTIALNNQTFYS